MTTLLIVLAALSVLLSAGKRVYDVRQNRQKVAEMREQSLRALEMNCDDEDVR